MADKYGVISVYEELDPEFERQIKALGCYDRMTSLRPIRIPIPEMSKHKKEIENRFMEMAHHQINEEGAQLIVEGCGAVFANLGFGAKERMEKKLGVPILPNYGVAIKTLEMLVSLKLTHSKKTYPMPS